MKFIKDFFMGISKIDNKSLPAEVNMLIYILFLSLIITLIIILIFVRNYSLYYSDIRNYAYFKRTILNQYYDINKINKAISNKIGTDYADDSIKTRFDNFAIHLLLDELKLYEEDMMGQYNRFLDKSVLAKYLEYTEGVDSSFEFNWVNTDIYYVKFNHFYSYIEKQFVKHFADLDKAKYLILDLRENTGGVFNSVKEISGFFLDATECLGKVIQGESTYYLYPSKKPTLDFEKIVILINYRTASSCEMFISALKNNLKDDVILLGTKTSGKGFAYKVEKLADGSAFIFLSSKWTDKYGNSYLQGIDPDIHIGKPKEYYEAIDDLSIREQQKDEEQRQQLKKAISILATCSL